MVKLLHPQTNAKPKVLEVDARRQGGSLSAHCECGWYCMHNHKQGDQVMLCVARHVIEIKQLDMKPKDLFAQWDEEE